MHCSEILLRVQQCTADRRRRAASGGGEHGAVAEHPARHTAATIPPRSIRDENRDGVRVIAAAARRSP